MQELDCNCPGHASRRRFLTSMAAAGAAAMLPGCAGTMSATDTARRPLIDVHHHFYPPEFLKAVGGGNPPAVQKWTPRASVDEMDRNGVTTSILSLWSIPGVWMGAKPEGMRRYARMVND